MTRDAWFPCRSLSLVLRAVLVLFVACVGRVAVQACGGSAPAFSTAGFHLLPDSGRSVFSLNPGWRFLKADVQGAEALAFDDSRWESVNLPHGLELLPVNASGGKNYRGPVWYRRRVRVPEELLGKRLVLHFEAIMGKSQIWVNGRRLAENFLGGYLPIVVDLGPADAASARELVLAVRADNSDDPTFLPGRPQASLDFTYFGGIYRDVWLVAHGPVYLTDPQLADRVAGGGVFARTTALAADGSAAELTVDSEVANTSAAPVTVNVSQVLRGADGAVVARAESPLRLEAGGRGSIRQVLQIAQPTVWTPDSPCLQRLETRLQVPSGSGIEVADGYATSVGIRLVEFRGADGLWLNGHPFGSPLIGANRHQDFAYLGNALPNSLHWRDALKLRAAGLRVIRGHYAQDPAFMDACDQLGLFVIPSQTGWQFWNKDPIFGERALASLRALVRSERNRPSVLFWEPILNETHYPASYAQAAREVVHAEYPVPGCAVACDAGSEGAEAYDIIYSPPMPGGSLTYNGWDGKQLTRRNSDYRQPLFTREWGDNVDDWNSQNSTSRCDRGWGEIPQLVQAFHYGQPPYRFTALETFYRTEPQHIGGTFWHSFDHQRGCHNEPFLGGIMDAFRQPKTAYWMFASQRSPELRLAGVDSGPVLEIAHEITPFSPDDITVFTNCDEVRLSVFGGAPLTWKRPAAPVGLPHPPAVFKNAFNYMDLKALHRARKFKDAKFTAEGLVGGKVVITTSKFPGKRSERITLALDNGGLPLAADSSDIAVVIASVTDQEGNVRRLASEEIAFTVEGEGEAVGGASIGANPRRVEWGTAPLLLRSTIRPGEIRVSARLVGAVGPRAKPAVLVVTSSPPGSASLPGEGSGASVQPMSPSSASVPAPPAELAKLKEALERAEEEIRQLRLREMERDQSLFETPALREAKTRTGSKK